ncbi:Receptor-like protein kinase [Quillaja saponaria]|uniref:non-specific serine/threonine protein kinase n=1 Tax=Quillaja saponaria TaxID=32244 RepID=A0AAD7M3U7_QUISA|nr:Receptor-like protein kinase [Quillaja saponaria]
MPSKFHHPSKPSSTSIIAPIILSIAAGPSEGRTRRPHCVYQTDTMAFSGTPWSPVILILLLLFYVVASSGASDSEALLKFKDSLDNKKEIFPSWNHSTTPCSDKQTTWVGVICVGGKVWGLKLEKMGLKGVIDLESLKELSNLRTISFMDNSFEGSLPDLSKLAPLKTIYLSNNRFSGEIPPRTFQGMQWLKKIYLAHNQFRGAIPSSLTSLPKLMDLRLEGNQFDGRIPDFQQRTLQSLNVSNNKLEGQIPASLSKMPASSFSGNERLCGGPFTQCELKSESESESESPKKPSVLSIVVVAIVVGVALAVTGVVIFLLNRRNQRAALSVEDPPISSFQKKSGMKEADEGSHTSEKSSVSKKSENMKLSFLMEDTPERFDLQDLLRASAEILGSGYFSSSYKAALLTGPVMVVKRFKQMNNVGREEFHEHVRRLGRLRHSNLLPLVAYYYRKEEKLLVTDYIEKGSLAARLHGHQALGQPSLDWPTRLKIVKGIAKGLQYLYNELPSLIAPHGHLKSSNVLLGESMDPLLTDYGLVPVMNQEHAHESMVVYKSPEYSQQGRITKKTDVWSLGILVLEIMTGKLPASFLQQGKGSIEDLANWVDAVVPKELNRVAFDKEMGATKNGEGEMIKLLKIAVGCCEGDVEKRWDLKEAVEKIEEVKERDGDEDFYSSYASEADLRSSRGLSDEIYFP